MQVQKSYHNASTTGELYLVPTPIGNFQDMTFRAVEVLQTVDFVCAEDTRNTGILLKHFDIPVKQISFHEHNAYDKIPELIALLKDGKRLAQVSDAGMPSISDPGHDLVKAAIEEGIPVISLPGASAGIYGDRPIVLVRELTKIYEEYQRGTISEIMEHITQVPLKGECLLIVSGQDETAIPQESVALSDIPDLVNDLIASGEKTNQAIKKVAKTYGLKRQEVYNAYHNID